MLQETRNLRSSPSSSSALLCVTTGWWLLFQASVSSSADRGASKGRLWKPLPLLMPSISLCWLARLRFSVSKVFHEELVPLPLDSFLSHDSAPRRWTKYLQIQATRITLLIVSRLERAKPRARAHKMCRISQYSLGKCLLRGTWGRLIFPCGSNCWPVPYLYACMLLTCWEHDLTPGRSKFNQ